MDIRTALNAAAEREEMRVTCDTPLCFSAENTASRFTVFFNKDGSVQAVVCETPDTSDITKLRESRKRGTAIETEVTDDMVIFRIRKSAYTAEIRI